MTDCIAHRPPAAVGQRLELLLLVPIEDFVADLSGYPKRPADLEGCPRYCSSNSKGQYHELAFGGTISAWDMNATTKFWPLTFNVR